MASELAFFNGICAIDLDNCVSDSGYYTQTAAEIVALMHSYTEYSPSGNGLHILFSAKGFQYDTKQFLHYEPSGRNRGLCGGSNQ